MGQMYGTFEEKSGIKNQESGVTGLTIRSGMATEKQGGEMKVNV
ncbi:hypothetical protein [Chitinophaga pinensis]|nr:hypothetical protein [Chitinophaga pinensis]